MLVIINDYNNYSPLQPHYPTQTDRQTDRHVTTTVFGKVTNEGFYSNGIISTEIRNKWDHPNLTVKHKYKHN